MYLCTRALSVCLLCTPKHKGIDTLVTTDSCMLVTKIKKGIHIAVDSAYYIIIHAHIPSLYVCTHTQTTVNIVQFVDFLGSKGASKDEAMEVRK